MQHCPVCGAGVEPAERYPLYLCRVCSRTATASDGRTLAFGNEGASGGFVASFAESGERYDSHVCFVNGRACWADEAHFGGIVIEAISLDRVRSAIDALDKRDAEVESDRRDSDEHYVIDLCDRILGRKASRQHRFEFLRGDGNTPLPIDAYYADLKLAVEYRERQHVEAVGFWDSKPTVSHMPRGQQRALYDQRRRDVLPKHGISLVEICFDDFQCDSRKRLRRVTPDDELVVRSKLAAWVVSTIA